MVEVVVLDPFATTTVGVTTGIGAVVVVVVVVALVGLAGGGEETRCEFDCVAQPARSEKAPQKMKTGVIRLIEPMAVKGDWMEVISFFIP